VVNTSDAISGETTLFAPGIAAAKDHIIIDNPSDAILGDGRRHTRHLQLQETMEVVVVRITCGNNTLEKSLGVFSVMMLALNQESTSAQK